MSIWTKITEQLDRKRDPNQTASWMASMFGLGQSARDADFTMAIIALGAKLAKADGQVTRDEVAAFKQVFTLERDDEAAAGRLFNLARQDTSGFEAYARQVGRYFHDQPERLQEVLTSLFMIAKADGVIDQSEHAFLRTTALEMGLSEAQFQAIAASEGDGHAYDPYAILGLEPHADKEQVRAAYRHLAKRYHPDVWAQTCCGEADCRALAEERMAQINRAYQTIKDAESNASASP